MANSNRARQFMPFSALKGYYDIILEQERIKEPKKELSETEAENLSYKLNQVKKGMMLKVTYYDVDAYTTKEGLVSNIDDCFRNITIVKTKIPFDNILDIEGEDIENYYF